MTKIVDLRPKRDLLNEEFEKYQFHDLPANVNSQQLSTNVFRKEISSDQSSLLEAQIFAYHNHLFYNPYDDSCWYIDEGQQIWRLLNGTLEPIHKLQDDFKECLYNPSIAFAGKNIVCIVNGYKTLEILIFNASKVSSFIFKDIEPGVILDSRCTESSLMIAIHGAVEIETKKRTEITFYTYSLEKDNDGLKVSELTKKQIWHASGTVEFVYIEDNAKYVQIASQNELQLKRESNNLEDSIRSIEEKEPESDIQVPKYSWSQSEDGITVLVKVPQHLLETKEKVKVTLNTLSVSFEDEVLVEGDLFRNIDASLTTWNRRNDLLEIELTKLVPGQMWTEMIKEDYDAEYLPNEALAAQIHDSLAHLCTDKQEKDDGASAIGFNAEQLEDCDLEGGENMLQRINLVSQKQTHLIMIRQSNRILFHQRFKTGQTVCFRHDHAGCIWVFDNNDDDDEWQMEHKFTFPGFGYIEASKKNKKFCLSSRDGSYVALIEHLRHIFIYEKPGKDAKVSKQRIIDIDTESPILGARILQNDLLVLTANKLYRVQINVA